MPEMLLPMFLLEPFDPTQIAFGSQCGSERRVPSHRSHLRPARNHVKQIQPSSVEDRCDPPRRIGLGLYAPGLPFICK